MVNIGEPPCLFFAMLRKKHREMGNNAWNVHVLRGLTF